MKKALLSACGLCLGATAAHAGGLDRSGQGINLIFEEGTVVQFGLGYTNPSVSGTLGGVDSGNIAESFYTPNLGYKTSLAQGLDFALIYDQPFGADVYYAANYPLSRNPLAPFGGRSAVLRAEARTDAITALLRYKFDDSLAALGGQFSVIGGLRAQRVSAEVSVPAVPGYQVESDTDIGYGYVFGVAWEKPEIAARVSLIYNSKISHNWAQTESFNTRSLPVGLLEFETRSKIETPQSINLDFQTGVAQDTLLFGSIRWVDWPQLVYDPPNYEPPSPLVDYDDDTFTYTLGLGYRFTDEFSGAVTLGYETSTDEPITNLGPTDGFWSIGVGGTYSFEKADVSAGVRYTDIGDATADGFGPGRRGDFSGNSAWSVGFQITYALD